MKTYRGRIPWHLPWTGGLAPPDNAGRRRSKRRKDHGSQEDETQQNSWAKNAEVGRFPYHRQPSNLHPEGLSELRGRLAEIVALTDRFCAEHLDAEFRDLDRSMALVLGQEGYPVTSGKAAGWAAGIAYSVAWVNFLGDPSQPHHMKTEDIAQALGVSPATLMNRAKVIRQGLDLHRMDPRWSTGSMLARNPLVWMVEVNGLPYDIRQAPRHVQEEAFRRGLIPFMPGER